MRQGFAIRIGNGFFFSLEDIANRDAVTFKLLYVCLFEKTYIPNECSVKQS